MLWRIKIVKLTSIKLYDHDKIEDKITLEGSVFFDYEGIWKNGNWYKSWVK